MSNSNINTDFLKLDAIAFPGLEGFPFDDLTLLASLSPISPSSLHSPNLPDKNFDVFDFADSVPFIQDHEVRSYLDGTLEPFEWDPFTFPSSAPSAPDFGSSSSFSVPFLDIPRPSSPTPSLSPTTTVPSAAHMFFSPETVAFSQFNYGSPSSSGETLAGSPPPAPAVGKRTTSEDSDSEDRSRKRVRIDDSQTHFVFFTTPQPANASACASTSRLPLNTPSQARCRCTFSRGNQKPARHWRTACPYNPAREGNRYPCEVDGCSMTFSRKDNRTRHVEKYH